MKDFNSDAHVEEWMADNGGVVGLRRAMARGLFAGQNRSLASAWLRMYDHKQLEEANEADRQLHERAVGAAEDSARSAKASARWAKWATLMAGIAVLISILQFFRGHN